MCGAHLKEMERLLRRSVSPGTGGSVVTPDLVGRLVTDKGEGGGDETSCQLVELGEVVRGKRDLVWRVACG